MISLIYLVRSLKLTQKKYKNKARLNSINISEQYGFVKDNIWNFMMVVLIKVYLGIHVKESMIIHLTKPARAW